MMKIKNHARAQHNTIVAADTVVAFPLPPKKG